MAKFCGHCGKQVRDDAKFCPNCGEQITDKTVDPSVTSTQYTARAEPVTEKVQTPKSNEGPSQGNVAVKKKFRPAVLVSTVCVIVAGFVLAGVLINYAKNTSTKVKGTMSGSNTITSGQKIQKNQIKNAGSLYTFLKIPDNYRCKMVVTLNGKNAMNADVWYKDGKTKMNSDLGIMKSIGPTLAEVGIDLSKMVSYSNAQTGELYTCIPSLKVAVKTSMKAGTYYDQSSVKSMVAPSVPFKGTRAVTLDGIQCTVYVFEDSGFTGEIYVRNSIETIIKCVATEKGKGTVDIYFKNMEIGMVTNGDVLMTNEANNYKKFNNEKEFTSWLANYITQKTKR